MRHRHEHPEVQDTLALIAAASLSHPLGSLLSAFVTEAIDPVVAARYLRETIGDGHHEEAQAAVHDWAFIVDCG
jgi:hypothetical protein